jgi:hypothetical protein
MAANLYSRLASRHPDGHLELCRDVPLSGAKGVLGMLHFTSFRVTEWQRNEPLSRIAAEMPARAAPPGNPPTP